MRRAPFTYILAGLVFLAAGVARGQTVTLISPNTTGLTWSGVEFVEWTTSGFGAGETVYLEVSSDGGIGYDAVARSLPHALGTFRFPTTTLANGSTYRMRVTRTGGGVSDASTDDFTVSNPVTGTAYFVNDTSTAGDVYCTAAGNDALHDGLSPATPRLTLQTIIDDYVLGPGDVVYIDTGRWVRVGTEAALTATDQGGPAAPVHFLGSPNGTTFTGNYQPGAARRFELDGSSYVSLADLVLEATLDHGIFCSLANNVTVSASTIRENGKYGLYFDRCSNLVLEDSLVETNGFGALYLAGGAGQVLSGNRILSNGATGTYTMYVDAVSRCRIRGNTIKDNHRTGLYLSRASRTSLQYNTLANNSGYGLQPFRCTDLTVTHNLLTESRLYNVLADRNNRFAFFNNIIYGRGIAIGRYELNIDIANNIFWSIDPGTYCIEASSTTPSEQGITSDFNLFFPTGGSRVGYWNGICPDLRSWVLTSRQDGRSLSENPLLADFAGGDYHPQSTEGRYEEGAWINDPSDSPLLNAGRAWAVFTGLSAPVSAGSATLPLAASAGFLPGPERVQVGDDIVSYTGISGNSLIGCTGVLDDHAAGEPVFQPLGSAFGREEDPNGRRVNIGLYGDTAEASKSSRKTLLVTSPEGGPLGSEKWARGKEIDWRTIGAGWVPGDSLNIAYSTDSSTWMTVTAGIAHDAGPYTSWNTASFPDSGTGRVRVLHTSGEPAALSGVLVVDNTPPVISLNYPADGALGQPLNTALIARAAADAPAGPHRDSPYYFRIDTRESFDSPDLRISDWIAGRVWYVNLEPGTDYYWQVRARDDADPANVSDFFAETGLPGSYWKFRIARVLFAEDIESETTGLRWMLDNYDLEAGDTIYVNPGTYPLTAGPLELPAADGGDESAEVRIEGFNGEVILDGEGMAANCLRVTGDYFRIENFSCLNAVGSGILITGSHNTLRGGRSYSNGGDGVEIRGDYNTILNTLVYGNLRAGFRLAASYRNRLENNTAANNGTREVYLEDAPPNGAVETALLNNILHASGAGRTAVYVENESRTGLSSNYNLIYAAGGAQAGHWGGTDLATFSLWTEASFQDQSSLSADPLFVGGGNYRLRSTAGSYKPGVGWTADGSDSPGLDRGDPLSACYLEPAPGGGRVNLGAYGNTIEASRSPSGGGTNYYVNDGETAYDYFCSTAGLPWPAHNGLSPDSPLDSIGAVFSHHTLRPGDTIYLDTGQYNIATPIIPPVSGTAGRPLTFAGSPRGAIVDGQGISPYCFELNGKSRVTIGGCVLANPAANSIYALDSHYLRACGNQIVGAVGDGIYLYQSYQAVLLENRVENNGGAGLYGYRANETCTIRDNILSLNGGNGAIIERGENLDFTGNRVADNGATGLSLSTITGARIAENVLSDNGPTASGTAAGIYLANVLGAEVRGNEVSGSRYGIDTRSEGAVIAGNRIYNNAHGLYLYVAESVQSRNNLVHDNQNWGGFVFRGSNAAVENNVFYNNGPYEIFLQNTCRQVGIRNNIIAPRAAGSYGTYVNVNPLLGDHGHRFDYNLFWVGVGARNGYWLGQRDTLWSWQTGSRQDGHSLAADPIFINVAGADFHLRTTEGRFDGGKWFYDGSNSPGLNRGDPDSDYSLELPPSGDRVNIGAYGNTAEASRSSIRSLAVVSPEGTADGLEKWSRLHDLTWGTIGDGWAAGDRFRLEYSPDGSAFTAITDGLTLADVTFPDWNTASLPDGATYQTRVVQTAGGTAVGTSGLFIIDNTVPINVGLRLPPDGSAGEPLSTSLLARVAQDSPAGLDEAAYFFQLDTAPTFDSPDLQDSGWTEYYSWNPDLAPATWYYWRVKVRDDAEPHNESVFCGFAVDTDGYGTFKTIGTYHATNVDVTGDEHDLRWILDNVELNPGDIVYVDGGDYTLIAPLELAEGDQGDGENPVRIIGIGGEVLLDGTGRENCLVISGDWFRVENFSFTNANGSGLLITGDHNTVQGGRSFRNGGDGIEATGDWTTVRNMLVYENGAAGIHLLTSHHSTLESNTCAANGTREVFLEDEPANAEHPFRPVGSTHVTAGNNILAAAGAGRLAIFVDEISQVGFSSDYNLLYAGGGAEVGYWNGETRSSFSDWTAAAGQDRNSLSGDPLFVGGENYHLQSTRGSWKGGAWSADTFNSPALDRGNPVSMSFYEPPPHGGRLNLGAYGNTLEASWAVGSTYGTSYYVNDSSTEWDYYCSTGGLPWPEHDGLSPDSPLDSIEEVIAVHSLWPGDTVYVDTGLYYVDGPILFPRTGEAENPITIAGSPRGTVLDSRGTAAQCFEIASRSYVTLANLSIFNPRDYGVNASYGHYLALAECALSSAGKDGALVSRSHGVRVTNCRSSYNGGHGFNISLQQNITGTRMEGCSARNNAGHGLYLFQGLSNSVLSSSFLDNGGRGIFLEGFYGENTVSGNLAEGNSAAGVYLIGNLLSTRTVVSGNSSLGNAGGFYLSAPNLRVSANRSGDNAGIGFHVIGAEKAQLVNNVSWENSDYGFRIERAPSSFFLNNLSYRDTGGMIVVPHLTNLGITIRNNILWTRGLGTSSLRLEVSDPAAVGWNSNYNLLRAPAGAFVGSLSGIAKEYPTLFEWQVASGQDGASIDYDPVFVDAAGDDFHLQSPLGSYHGGYWRRDLNASPALNQGQVYMGFSTLAADIFPASPFIDLDDAAAFTAGSDWVEINGDIILYTAKSGNRLTGVSGIEAVHPAGSGVFQPVGADYTREAEPHGDRINIGPYGGMGEASLALVKTLPVISPLGGEKWSGVHKLRWLAIPAAEWIPGEPIEIEYSTDGFNYYYQIDTVYYPTQDYDWDTALGNGDLGSYQIRVNGGGLSTTSGVFMIDNTPPAGVGCLMPEDGDFGLPSYIPLRGLEPIDALAGLHERPYYFQVDTSHLFSGPGLQSSGWLERNAWRPALEPGKTYYWRVKARDSADLPNESGFCGFVEDTDGYGTFATANVFRALDVESATTGLRWILDNHDLRGGDTILLAAGVHALASPVTVRIEDGGSRYFPVRIAGLGTGAVLDGADGVENCLILEADYVILENISFTAATGAGLAVTGANNIVREGASFLHGGAGAKISGAANKLVNFLLYGNGGEGVRLDGAEGNRVVNVTAHGNGGGGVACTDAPHSYLRNNILWATAAGTHSVYVDLASQSGFLSDYNNLLADGGAFVGHWGGDRAGLGDWQGASLADLASISLDPLFADPAGGDYHLKSETGRWSGWIAWANVDGETSPSIDAGDPAYPCHRETSPKRARINQGTYGNTFQASRSYQPGVTLPGTNYFLNNGSLADNVFTTAAGSDGNNGRSPAAPKRTLAGPGGILTIDLEPGDTVFVDTGEYPLSGPALLYNLHSGTAANPVALVGSPNISLVDGNLTPLAGLVVDGARHIAFDRLHMANTLGAVGTAGAGVRINSAQSILLRENTISWQGQARGEGSGGVSFTLSTGISLLDNRIAFTTAEGVRFTNSTGSAVEGNLIRTNRGAGIHGERSAGFSLAENIIYNNRGNGIYLFNAASGQARGNSIYSNRRAGAAVTGNDLELLNNLVYGNNTTGMATRGGIDATGSGLTFAGNTLYRNRGNEFTTGSPGVNFRNNIVWADGLFANALWFSNANNQFSDFNILTATGGATIGVWTTGTAYDLDSWQLRSSLDSHSLDLDPLLADPAGPDGVMGGAGGEDDDFHPRSTEGSFHFGRWTADTGESPGLNAGNPEDPYEVETEPNGQRVNIGAYGNTAEASRSSLDSLFLRSPYGGSFGAEKWSGEHDLLWSAFGSGWVPGDTVDLEFTTNGNDFFPIHTAAWDGQTYSTWDTAVLADGRFYQVRVSDSLDPAISSISGRFIVDNTPPVTIGAVLPPNNRIGIDPENADFQALAATDALAGLHALPYYFRIDTVNSFDSPELVTSDWVASRDWTTHSLIPDRWYYWQVAARDAADLPNVSEFCANLNVPGTTWVFKTARVYHVTSLDAEDLTGLRYVLDNAVIEEGDIIRLNAETGFFEVTGAAVIVPPDRIGTPDLPIRIEGHLGRPLIYGDGVVDLLFDVQGHYIRVQGIDFTGSIGTGLLISGDNNTVNRVRSFEQGGAGVELTGDTNLVKNTMCYLNGGAGILLNGGSGNRVYNNSLYGNRDAGVRLAGAPQSNLRNNISWALDPGSFAVSADGPSGTGLVSNYNDLYTTENGLVGLWNGQTQATLAAWRAAAGQDANSISANPQFYQIALLGNREYIYDFHLRSPGTSSPCFNAGVSLAGVVDDDYDGEDRPFGDKPDIGADEWVNTNIYNSLPDYWELQYFGDLDPDRRDNQDPDGDLLTNIREYNYYTDPTNPDTDGDGLTDWEEVDIYFTNPLDPDSDWDGLPDGIEVTVTRTDPFQPDTDGDGLLDGWDVSAVGMDPERIAYFESLNIVLLGDTFKGELTEGTDPLDPDTDGDWCPDGWEVYYGLDPLDNGSGINGGTLNDGGVGDPDGDRLNNYEEYLAGTSPIDGGDPITRYVDGGATGAGNGTSWADAWTTIQASLDWKAQTDIPAIVLVSGGVYYEHTLELDENHAGLALMGDHPYQRPVIDGAGAGGIFTAFNLQTVKIDSFEIRNADTDQSGGAFQLTNSSPTLSNLLIHNNRAAYGGAIYSQGASSPVIIGNTIAKNTGTSGYGGVYIAAGLPWISDNILWFNGVDLRGSLTTDQVSFNNLGSQEGGFLIIGYAGNISREPGFRHYGADRFHLSTYFSETNPAHGVNFTGQTNPNINSGTSQRAALADYEGEGRWNYLSQPVTGGGLDGYSYGTDGYYYYDIGADEYVDSDYNTLLDWWEMKHWSVQTGQDPAADPDGDGLPNFWEYYYLTNPLKYDTAVSGMNDLEEVIYWDITHWNTWSGNPGPSGRQKWDSNAYGYGLNILTADVDGDGLIDGFSLQRSALPPEDEALLAGLGIVDVAGWFMGEQTVGTDPANPDTDDDWLDDGDEVYYWVYTHNERHPDSAHTSWDTDWDGDGIPNILDWDGDGDLTPDGWEAFFHLDPNDDGYYYLEHGAGGDPDDDRLNNYIEYLFGTHPRDGDDPDFVIVDINGTIGLDCDYNYIKDAIAGETGPIRIIVRPGIYPESNIMPKEKMALLGEYAFNTIIDASGGGRGVVFSGVNAALLDGFTISNAAYPGAGAALLCYSSSPFISNSVISFNTSTGPAGYGAALYARESSHPMVVNCTIASNRGTAGIGGVALDASSAILLTNNIFWDNQTDLFGVQTDMVHYSNLESGIFEGVNFNLSTDPIFTNLLAGDFHIYWQSPMVCAAGYPLAGGYDMDGTKRPQLSCPPEVDPCFPQNSFNIGAHEARYEPSPTPSVTPTPTATVTPTPSVTPPPTTTPTVVPQTTQFPTRTPTPIPTATPEPPLPPTPPTTPVLPTRTPTPVPTATPEHTPSPTPYGYKTPSPTPSPIDFYYRDPVQNSWLNLYINGTWDTYYSIGWAGDDWLPIFGLPPYTWYAPVWTYGTGPGETQWGEWTYHGTETQYLEPLWPTPTPTPWGYKTPTPIPDFYHMDEIHPGSDLYLWISNFPDPNTYYTIGVSLDFWQPIWDVPDYSWYQAQWVWETITWWSAWTYHETSTQYLYAFWTTPTPTPTPYGWKSPTPSITPTPPFTPSPTRTPRGYRTPSPSVTPTCTPTPTPSFAYWYSAAGATRIDGYDFDTYLAINNPTDADAYVEFRVVDSQGLIKRINDIISPESRYTLDVNKMLQGTRGEHNPSISMMIYDLTDRIIMVDRSMYWNPGGVKMGGGHNSMVSNDRFHRWFIPEGATHLFDNYIHVLNPDRSFPAKVKVTFMNMASRTWSVQTIVGPESNWTIHANQHVTVPGSISTDVESLPQDDPAVRAAWPPEGRVPIVADRTMYWDTEFWNPGLPNIKWIDGHSSRGTTEKSTRWYISEGATHMFDCYVLIMNPSMTETAEVKVTFMDAQGGVQEELRTIPPHTRDTIFVNQVMNYVGSFSAEVVSLNNVHLMVERAMYWKAGGIAWAGGHDSIAAVKLAPVWYLPEGATNIFDQYVLLGNPDPVRDAEVGVTFYFETRPPEKMSVSLPSQKRVTIFVNNYLKESAIATRLEEKSEPFSAKIPFVAERAMYWNPPPPYGVYWGGGHATIGIPVWNEGK